MGRKIAKIIFIFIGVVFTFLAYVIGYNSGASTNYFDLVKASAESENHADMCKAFSMYQIPYDANPIAITNKGEKNEVVVYNAINQLNLTYYEETESTNKSVNYAKIQYMYYFFIYNPTFNYGAVEGKNETGLRFYNESGDKTYTFHYIVDDNSNKNEVLESPKTPKEALFNTKRNMITTYSDYGFVFTSISELFMESVREELGGPVSKFELLDNKGDVVSGTTIELKLDFSEEFYADMAEFKRASVDIFEIEQISSSDRTTEQKDRYDEATKYINEFNIDNYKDKGYDKGFSKDDIYTTKLIFSSIGIASLFALSVAIIYVLVFYFRKIKNWVFGGRHSRTTQRIVPNKMPVRQEPAKTNFDRVNEKRAEDLAKKRAQEEEIRKRGNMIIAPKEEAKPVEDVSLEAPKIEDVTPEEIKPVEETSNIEEVKETQTEEVKKEE